MFLQRSDKQDSTVLFRRMHQPACGAVCSGCSGNIINSRTLSENKQPDDFDFEPAWKPSLIHHQRQPVSHVGDILAQVTPFYLSYPQEEK